MRHHLAAAVAMALTFAATSTFAAQDKPTPTTKEILATSKPAEWRTPAPDNLLYMQLPQGRVVIELAPEFSPLHAANIRTLVRQGYFDGLAIVRVQDNFVTQWDDPNGDDGGDKAKMHPLGKAKTTLPPEFTRAIVPKQQWTPLPDGDVYGRRSVSPKASRWRATQPRARNGWCSATAWSAWRATWRRTAATAARCTP